jgi:hypothetical protein
MVIARLVVAVLLKTWSLLPDRYYIDNGDTIGYAPSPKLASRPLFIQSFQIAFFRFSHLTRRKKVFKSF